jgi:hypothetical protein
MLSVSMRVTASNTSRSKTNDNEDEDDSSCYKKNSNSSSNSNNIMRDTPTHSPPLSATRAAWCQGQAVPQSAAP